MLGFRANFPDGIRIHRTPMSGDRQCHPMEPPSKHTVSVLNESGRRLLIATVRKAVETALEEEQLPPSEVCVLLTQDEVVRELNRTYRNLDESTDVLTFCADQLPGAPLGDIAISVPYAERQAKARKVSLTQELSYLAIHGALHLVGYDDITEELQSVMVKRMNEVAVAAGLKPDDNWSSLLHGETE